MQGLAHVERHDLLADAVPLCQLLRRGGHLLAAVGVVGGELLAKLVEVSLHIADAHVRLLLAHLHRPRFLAAGHAVDHGLESLAQRFTHPALVAEAVRHVFITHIVSIAPLLHRTRHTASALAILPPQVVVEGVEPLMRQTARAANLGQVDHLEPWLVVRSAGPFAPVPTSTEGNGQFTVETKRLGLHAQDVSKVQERIIRAVQRGLSIAAHVPVAKLPTTESERVLEHLGGDIAHAGGAAGALQPVQPGPCGEGKLVLNDLRRMRDHVGHAFLIGGKAALHHGALALADFAIDGIRLGAIWRGLARLSHGMIARHFQQRDSFQRGLLSVEDWGPHVAAILAGNDPFPCRGAGVVLGSIPHASAHQPHFLRCDVFATPCGQVLVSVLQRVFDLGLGSQGTGRVLASEGDHLAKVSHLPLHGRFIQRGLRYHGCRWRWCGHLGNSGICRQPLTLLPHGVQVLGLGLIGHHDCGRGDGHHGIKAKLLTTAHKQIGVVVEESELQPGVEQVPAFHGAGTGEEHRALVGVGRFRYGCRHLSLPLCDFSR